MKQLALVALLAIACGREGQAENFGAAGAGKPAPAVSSPALPSAACPATHLWTECSLLERLERAGLAPQKQAAPATEPPLTAKGITLKVGNGELKLFIYPDPVMMLTDQRLIDRKKYLAPDKPQGMTPLPTLIENSNVVAVLRTRNDHLRERVADAITAGPPMPPQASPPPPPKKKP